MNFERLTGVRRAPPIFNFQPCITTKFLLLFLKIMSFRKRSVPLANSAKADTTTNPGQSATGALDSQKQSTAPGVRISPSFSLPTVSTGLSSLDSLLRLGAGLALGSSLVIEEDGTTDYTGTILKCFASQGVVHGHKTFVLAVEQWGAHLPGVAEEKRDKKDAFKESNDEKMKIAWRYERLGAHGSSNRDRIGRCSGALQVESMPEMSNTTSSNLSAIKRNTGPILAYF